MSELNLVLLYAYQRPELTEQVIKSTLTWNKLDKLLITVDGLRQSATDSEKIWREATIGICERYSLLDPRVALVVWPDNPGLTNHILRSLKHAFKMSNVVIAIEDDTLVSTQGFDFLANVVSDSTAPQIAAGYNKFFHTNVYSSSGFRNTLFPTQWSTSLNASMFRIVEEVWQERKVEWKIVARRIINLSGIGVEKKARLFMYWYRYFKNSLKSHRHTDIVVQYAVFKSGAEYKVPWGDYVEDIAFQDWRGMNIRHNPLIRNEHVGEFYEFNGALACKVCDVLGGRIEPSFGRYIRKWLLRRIKASG
jgi:hypothetical protein